jgi:hypothetical protein
MGQFVVSVAETSADGQADTSRHVFMCRDYEMVCLHVLTMVIDHLEEYFHEDFGPLAPPMTLYDPREMLFTYNWRAQTLRVKDRYRQDLGTLLAFATTHMRTTDASKRAVFSVIVRYYGDDGSERMCIKAI